MSKTEKPWERQKGETEQAFGPFPTSGYLGLKRSNHEVCQRLSKSRQLISRWKSRYEWDERVRAYDNEMERQAHAEAVKDLKDMTKRHTKIAVQMQKKALEALEKLKVEDMTPRDIKEYIKIATELERLNRSVSASDNAIDEEEQTRVEVYMPEKEADEDE